MKYYVTMTRMFTRTAIVEVDAESEGEAVDKAEDIYVNDTDDTQIKWEDGDGIEGVDYYVETNPPTKL